MTPPPSDDDDFVVISVTLITQFAVLNQTITHYFSSRRKPAHDFFHPHVTTETPPMKISTLAKHQNILHRRGHLAIIQNPTPSFPQLH
mmetsp:Transcript_56316/g.67495  ORF Transcript_56316/g.67495 Transcript_56316/m.67495 type:complete len:88 (+) Transcript_56316:53-316(+)